MFSVSQGEGISVKEMYDQIVTIQTLEYHNLNLSWRALLLEIKKDYKNAIIAQVINIKTNVIKNVNLLNMHRH